MTSSVMVYVSSWFTCNKTCVLNVVYVKFILLAFCIF